MDLGSSLTYLSVGEDVNAQVNSQVDLLGKFIDLSSFEGDKILKHESANNAKNKCQNPFLIDLKFKI